MPWSQPSSVLRHVVEALARLPLLAELSPARRPRQLPQIPDHGLDHAVLRRLLRDGRQARVAEKRQRTVLVCRSQIAPRGGGEGIACSGDSRRPPVDSL